jgi:hypothetical protein
MSENISNYYRCISLHINAYIFKSWSLWKCYYMANYVWHNAKKKSIFKPVNTTWTFFSKKETKKDSKASN